MDEHGYIQAALRPLERFRYFCRGKAVLAAQTVLPSDDDSGRGSLLAGIDSLAERFRLTGVRENTAFGTKARIAKHCQPSSAVVQIENDGPVTIVLET